ncbi:VanZ family protein [Rhodococcus sp. USK13]|uniref:VanZ family protein n=1 Tax=Rhodococcus sp. USK13 TaxID=2806442 RepID=UPI001BCBC660|nr:VanZ family protein [Rhodococcus sp. USK13]
MRSVPVVALTGLALIMLLSPASATPTGPEHADKVMHALLFAALAGASRYALLPVRVTVLWLTAFAVVTEILQGILPIGRHGSVWDLLADTLGVVMGLAVHSAVMRSRSNA